MSLLDGKQNCAVALIFILLFICFTLFFVYLFIFRTFLWL